MTDTDTPQKDDIDDLPPPKPKLDPVVVERNRVQEMTAAFRLRRYVGQVASNAQVTLGLSLILAPFLLYAALTLDLPYEGLDRFASVPSLRPSLWISQGEVSLTLSVLAMVMMTRRHGALIVARAHGMAWLFLIMCSIGMLIYLAPQLVAEDFPRPLYILGICVGWFMGAQVAVYLYDLLRGGTWWRAPFLGTLGGFAAQTILYFPLAYNGTDVPWGRWLVADLTIKTVLAASFVGVYFLLRKRVRPKQGLGGGR